MISIPKSKIPKRQILNQENVSKEKDIAQEVTQKLDKMTFESERDNIVHEKELKQRLEQIEKLNNYKQSKNLGDMPKVFAFEVENNIRNVIREVLKPVIGQNEKVVLNITDLQQMFQELQINLGQLNKKLDSQISLTDQVKDANQKTKNMKDEYYREIQKLEKEISQVKQLLSVHDIKIGKINDERNIIFESRDKLKKDMREFEKLCQDFTKYSAELNKSLEEKFQNEVVQINIDIERLQRNIDEFKSVQRFQKKHQESLLTSINVVQSKLDNQQKSIWKLESLENFVKENERFLGFVQPMRIQEMIYRTLNNVVKTKDQKLSLYEYQKEKLQHLIEDMNQADQKVLELKMKQKEDFVSYILHGFNKIKYQNPEDFDEPINELKQAIQDEENEELQASLEEQEKQEKQYQKPSQQIFSSQPVSQRQNNQKQQQNISNERNKSQPPQQMPFIGKNSKNSSLNAGENLMTQQTGQPQQISEINLQQQKTEQKVKEQGVDTNEIKKENKTTQQTVQNDKKQEIKQDKKIDKKDEKIEQKKIEQKKTTNQIKLKQQAPQTESIKSLQSQIQPIIQKQVIKLTDLNITSKQIYMFASRIGRRLLKNQKFLDKLAQSLDDAEVTDYSETIEENWGQGKDQDDLKGYTYQRIQKNIQYSEGEQAVEKSNKRYQEIMSQESKSKIPDHISQVKEENQNEVNEEKDLISEKQQIIQQEQRISIQNSKYQSKLSSIQSSDNKNVLQSIKNESVSLNRSQDTSSKQSKIIYDQEECNRIQSNASQSKQILKSSDLSSKNIVIRNISNKSAIQEQKIVKESTKSMIKEQNQIQEQKIYHYENQQLQIEQQQINDQYQTKISSQNIEINEIKQKLDAYKRKFDTIEKLLQKRDNIQSKPEVINKKSEKVIKQNEPMKKVQKNSVDSQVEVKLSTKQVGKIESEISESQSQISSNIYNKKTKNYQSQDSVAQDLQGQKIEELEKDMIEVQQFLKVIKYRLNLNDKNDIAMNSFDHEKWTFEQQNRQSTGGYMQKMFDERIEQMELLKNQMKIELKRLIRQDFQVQQKFDILNQSMKSTNQMQDGISNRIGLCESSLAIIFKLMRISYALAHQDEIDRQDVFLMGGKIQGGLPENTANQNINQSIQEQSIDPEQQSIISHQDTTRPRKQQQSVQPTFQGVNMPQVISSSHRNHKLLQFDTNCLTCAHGKGSYQIPSLFKAFKIACLSYKPSPVYFDNKFYERNQLVEAHGCLLIIALKQMKHLDFNNVDNTLLGTTSEQIMEQNMKYNQELKIQFDDLLSNSINSDNNNILERNQKKKGQYQNLTPIQMKKVNVGENLTSNNFNQQIALEQQNLRGSNFFGFLQNYDNDLLIGEQKQINSARSKEYTKLASQIPSVYLVKNGKFEINNQIIKNTSLNSNQNKKQTNQRYLKSINKNEKNIELTNQSLNISKMPDEQKWNAQIDQKKNKLNDFQNVKQSLQTANMSDIHQIHSVLTPTQFPNQKNIFNFNTINVVGSQNSVSPNHLVFQINQHTQPTSNSRVKGGRIFSIDNQQDQKQHKVNPSHYQPNQQSIQNLAALQVHRPPLVTAGGQLQSSRINQHFNNRNNMAYNTTQQNDVSLPSVLIPVANQKNNNAANDQIKPNIRQSMANFSQSNTEGIFSNDSGVVSEDFSVVIAHPKILANLKPNIQQINEETIGKNDEKDKIKSQVFSQDAITSQQTGQYSFEN